MNFRSTLILPFLIFLLFYNFLGPAFSQTESGKTSPAPLEFLIPKAGEIQPTFEKKVVGDFSIWLPPGSKEIDVDTFACSVGSGYGLVFEVRPSPFGPPSKISFSESDLARIKVGQEKSGAKVAWMKQIAENAIEFEESNPSKGGKNFCLLYRVYIFEGRTVVLRVLEPTLNAEYTKELMGSLSRTFEISEALANRTIEAAKKLKTADLKPNSKN